MKKQTAKWRSHIGLGKIRTFQKKKRGVMLLLFSMDLDEEIKKAGPRDYIEVKAQWRNVGPSKKSKKIKQK